MCGEGFEEDEGLACVSVGEGDEVVFCGVGEGDGVVVSVGVGECTVDDVVEVGGGEACEGDDEGS